MSTEGDQILRMINILFADRRCNYFVCSDNPDESPVSAFFDRTPTDSLEDLKLSLQQQTQVAAGLYPVFLVRYAHTVPRLVPSEEVGTYMAEMDSAGESEYAYRVAYVTQDAGVQLFQAFQQVLSQNGTRCFMSTGSSGMSVLGNLRQGQQLFMLWIAGEPLPANTDRA